MIKIPNYEIGKLAGKGGVAEVYLARHKLLDRAVAIKIISPTHSNELADKRFLKEARVVAGLSHPNIVSIYDVGVLGNKYYIIMEYLEGGDLKQQIKKGISISQALNIMKQIASALAHAHGKGFIHRDIKSQNIMFRSDGIAVLTDFGIVKDLAADTGYTLDGTSLGTPNYMSPEQAQGAPSIDWRTDLYSLGVTFYEMLTGSLPYTSDSAIAVAIKHIKEPVPKLPDQFARFQPIIDQLMAKAPENRYQSAQEVIHAIDAIKDADLPKASIEQKSVHKQKALHVSVIIFLVLVGIFSGVVAYRWDDLTDLFAAYKTIKKDRITNINQKKASDEPKSAEPEATRPAEKESPQEPTAPAGKNFLADAISKKEYAEALTYISRAREEIREPSNEMLQKADSLSEANELKNAGDIYNSILTVDPQNKSAILGLLNVSIRKKQALERSNQASIAEFDELLSLLNNAIAHTDHSYFKQMTADLGESVYNYAKNQYQEQHLDQAAQWAQAGLKFMPDHPSLKKLNYRILAQISLNENRLTSPDQNNALMYYQKILQMEPEDVEAKKGVKTVIEKYKAMALTAQQNKSYKESLSFIQKARSIDPDNKELKTIEYIISGDNESSEKTRGEFYLKALKLEPTLPLIKDKIKNIITNLNDRGNTEEANALLTMAMQIAPNDPVFNETMRKADLFEKEKGKINNLIITIKNIQAFPDKMEPYRILFSNLISAAVKFNREKISILNQAVMAQVKNDIQHLKNQNEVIPGEFIDLVAKYFPELNEYMMSAQYDILIQNGDNAVSKQERADYYLEAFRMDKNKAEAKDKIILLAMNLQKDGMKRESIYILNQAAEIAPDDPQLTELIQQNKPLVKVFATNAGCGNENIVIQKAPVSNENLTLCIQYRNLEPDSIVNVLLENKTAQSIEVPVVLDGRSGNKAVSIAAPLEGFSLGNYSIALKQNGKIISKTMIEFVPKRR